MQHASIKALSKTGKVSKEDFIPKDIAPAMREMLSKFGKIGLCSK